MPVTPNFKTHSPQGHVLEFGLEYSTEGTANDGARSDFPIIREFCKSVDEAPQREIFEAAQYGGYMTDVIGLDEISHYQQFTVGVSGRCHGWLAWALLNMMGSQSYVPTVASNVGTHLVAPVPDSNYMDTFSCWYRPSSLEGDSDASYTKLWTACKVTSIHATWANNTDFAIEIGIWGKWHTFAALPLAAANRHVLGETGLASGGTDTVQAAPAPVYTPATGVTTFTVNAGHGVNYRTGLAITAGTLSGVVSAISTDLISVTGMGAAPASGAAVTQNVPTGYTNTVLMGYQSTYTLRGSSGTPYSTVFQNGDITIERPLEAVFATDSQTIKGIAAGPIRISGQMTHIFQGYTGNNIGQDFTNYSPTGSYDLPNIIRMTDSDGNYIEVQGGPWKWNPYTLDYSGEYVKGQGSFRSYNQPGKLTGQVGSALSGLKQVTVRNNITTAMIA